MNRPSLMAANWKMYKTVLESRAYARELLRRLDESPLSEPEQVIFPTLAALTEVARVLSESAVKIGAQNLDVGVEGPRTGAVSAYLLHEARAAFVIVGHSERRALYGEDDALVRDKTAAAMAHHLVPIVCVGESLRERQDGQTDLVIARQVGAVLPAVKASEPWVVAYEPIWAIGTGLVPDAVEAGRVAGLIRDGVTQQDPQLADRLRILYGGSVNRDNIQEFAAMAELDGALVGGASLDVDHWMELCRGWGEVRS